MTSATPPGPPAAAPVDRAVRDEIAAALDLTMFVEAGAGTGKTTALVSRVVALVAGGRLELRDLAAITFTEAAAAELRDRIRLELERAEAGATDPPLGAVERRRCAAALDQLDDAALSTLHGFAQRVLARHPIEAGLPPRFEVIDDVEAGVAFEQRWGQFVDGLLGDADTENALLAALALGLRLDDLRRVARTMHENVDRVATTSVPVEPVPAVAAGPVVAPLRGALALAGRCHADDDRLLTHLLDVEYHVGGLAGAADDLDRLDLLAGFPRLAAPNRGDRRNWDCDVADVRALLAEAQAALETLLGGARRAALTELVARVREFVLAYADDRRRDGRLEFHDLLVLARDLLARERGVRAALASRFHALLIDEFQDTDPLQIEIAVLLATGDPDAGAKPWHEVGIEPGRLFLVGDPKQSIYRFRRADLALHHRVQGELRDGHRRLEESFRSVPGVIDWVNHVFGGLLGGGEPGVQAPHVALHAFRGAVPGARPAVQTFGGPVDAPRIGVVREREAAEVAALVREIKTDRWPVLDPAGDEVRAARYDDIALLLPTRTALPDLEHALDHAGVPVRIESQSLVYSTAEVRDLLAVLAAVDDPTDEVALVAALRTPAFGCADDDLVAFHAAGGQWDYRSPLPDGVARHHPVARAMEALHDLHERRWWQTVSETVETVVRERRLLELAVAYPRPRDHWRRLRFLLDRARAYDEVGGSGLRGFVEWVQQQSDERARAVEVVVPEPDDDAVRILTVHGAKGLEFPIVVLAGLNAAPRWRTPSVLWTADGGLEVAVGAKSSGRRVETDGYEAEERRDRALDEAERDRLLYVAATRARDHLLVSLHLKAGDRRSPGARLREHADGAPATRLTVDVGTAPPGGSPPPGAPEEDGSDRDAWLAARTEVLARAARPASAAATALVQERVADAGLEDDVDDDRPPWRRGRAGTAVGRAVHAVLQTVDMGTAEGLAAAARAQALAEGIPSREPEVRALADSVLAAPVVRAAVANGRYWREVPVATAVDGTILEGFVDLLVDGPDGLVVVDYKTDAVADDMGLDDLMAKYRVQGAAYALALERVLGRDVARCVFVFARTRRPAVERDVAGDELAAARTEVRARVSALGAPATG